MTTCAGLHRACCRNDIPQEKVQCALSRIDSAPPMPRAVILEETIRVRNAAERVRKSVG